MTGDYAVCKPSGFGRAPFAWCSNTEHLVLNYRTVTSRATSLTKIGHWEFNTEDPQAVLVTLPKKTVTTELIPPGERLVPGAERQRQRPRQHADP
ncbi:hypothetical protein ACFY2Z_15785 [Streptomyces sp. NPDC001222]|uniref:hypothetical protein n=1 Tax=Streptomyces sp. NPDC001222 TaxID=3364548 RepID=UPI0036C9E97F